MHLNLYLGLRLQVADLVDETLFTACICIMNVLCFPNRNNGRYLWKRIPQAIKSVSLLKHV